MTTTTTNTPALPRVDTPFLANRPDAPASERIMLYCERHWQPYKEDHTLNGKHASQRVLDLLMQNEAFQRECGRDDKTETPADMGRLFVEGAKLGPVCCHLGDDAADGVLAEARVLRERAMEALARSTLTPVGGHRTSRPGGA